jgi:protease I
MDHAAAGAEVHMSERLTNKRIAALVEEGFEEVELLEPRQALEDAGADVEVVSPKSGSVRSWRHTEWGDSVDVDLSLDRANPADFDALLLPGGVMNPDKLRMNAAAVRFVKAFVDDGKPIAAICHGPWLLIEAGLTKGKTITSWPSLKSDLQNAGATWVDRECVVDNGLVTSRKPADIPAFNEKMIEEFAEGRHDPNAATLVATDEHRE